MTLETSKDRKNLASHTLFKTGDPKAPEQILDRNGEVALGLCTKCGAAESELHEEDCLTRLLKRSAERVAEMGPFEKALMFARQRRSWVIGEMMLGDDGKEGLSRERAEELYRGLPEGAMLAELERLSAQKAQVVPAPMAKAVQDLRDHCNIVIGFINGGLGAQTPGFNVINGLLKKADEVFRASDESDPLAPVREGQGDAEARKAHYGDGVQPWDTILASGWAPAFAASNVVKYLRRTKNPAHSLESARWYYARLLDGCAGNLTGRRSDWQLVLDRLEIILTQEERARLRG